MAKTVVFHLYLFFGIALGIHVLKSIFTYINTENIHTYVRIYIYREIDIHRQLLSCDVGIDRFLLSSLIQPWGCTGFMAIPGQAVDVPQLSLGRSHGRWHAPSPKSQHQRYKTSSRYWWFLAFTVSLYCNPWLSRKLRPFPKKSRDLGQRLDGQMLH